MSQASTWGVPSAAPATPTLFASRSNAALDAILTHHSGTSRPAYAVDGTIWADTSLAGGSPSVVIIKYYDGAADTELFRVNRTLDRIEGPLSYLNLGATEDIASATTCDIGATRAWLVRITGTTAITSLGTVANQYRSIRFGGTLTLTHNATTLILPGGANITTAAGDTAMAVSDGSGNWRVINYTRASGFALSGVPRFLRTVNSASSAGDRTLTAADAGGLIIFSGTTDFTMTLDAAATLGNGWSVDFKHDSRCLVTLDPNGSETIDGATTLPVCYKQTGRIYSTGSTLHTSGIQRQVLLESWVTSGTTSEIAMLLPPGYNGFKLRGNYTFSTTAWLLFQLSTNGGSTYISTGYVGTQVFGNSGGGSASGAASNTSGLSVGYHGTATVGASVDAEMQRGTAAYNWKASGITGWQDGGGLYFAMTLTSSYSAAVNVNAARLLPSSGTISANSVFSLWGIQQ